MNSEDYSGYIATQVRKTQVVTLYQRQKQMQDFYNNEGTSYIGLAKTSPWSDPNDSDISDTFPPIPDETMTQQMI